MNPILKTVLVLSIYIVVLNIADGKLKSASITTSEQIAKEIKRFAPIQKLLNENEVDIRVRFSKTIKENDEEEGDFQYDSFELGPLSDATNSTDDDSKLDEDTLEVIFFLAKHYDVTAVVSSEKFDRDGSLVSREFHVEDVMINFNNGSTKITYKNIAEHVQHKDEKALERYVNLMKGFELPVEVRRYVYNKNGEIEKDETSKYEPRKVKVVKSNMPIDMQLLCAEALKQSFVIKKEVKDRMNLVSKYLGLKFPLYSWKGEVGDLTEAIGNHTVLMKAILDGETYSVSGKNNYLD